MKVWLDTTALVLLNFRQAKHAAPVKARVPAGAEVGVSAYVLFELARGYLTRLRELLTLSYECEFPDELREKAEAGTARYTRHGDTWTDVLNDDFCRVRKMPGDAGAKWQALSLPMFRMRLRTLILDGWDACTHWRDDGEDEPKPLPVWNPCGCRSNLPAPERDSGKLKHTLPTAQCGQPGNCGVLAFVKANAAALERVRTATAKLKAQRKKSERERRTAGIEHMLSVRGQEFDGTQCHACGDALIALESSRGANDCVVTKDKDFTGICRALGPAKPALVPHVV